MSGATLHRVREVLARPLEAARAVGAWYALALALALACGLWLPAVGRDATGGAVVWLWAALALAAVAGMVVAGWMHERAARPNGKRIAVRIWGLSMALCVGSFLVHLRDVIEGVSGW